MKHRRDDGRKMARVRVSLDMFPKNVQRANKDKQLDILKKAFKRACGSFGLFQELKEREFYIKPGEKRRKAKMLKKAIARGEIKEFSQNDDKDFEEYVY